MASRSILLNAPKAQRQKIPLGEADSEDSSVDVLDKSR